MLAAHLQPSNNSFALVRLLCASAVIFSHAYLLTSGLVTEEPLTQATSFPLGAHAVNAFFFLSGLTLARSLDRDPSAFRFAVSRILRIVPGLLFFGVVLSFVLGPLLTICEVSGYLTDFGTWRYPAAVLLQFHDAQPPHGLFLDQPVSGRVNEPLWTIRYEIIAYAGLLGLSLAGLSRTVIGVVASLATSLGLWLIWENAPGVAIAYPAAGSLGRFGFAILLGVTAYRLRNHIPTAPWVLVLAVLLAWALGNTALAKPAWCLAAAAFVIVVGVRNYGPLTRFTSRDDLSYGVYLFGWPVQQAALVFFPLSGALLNAALSLPIAMIVALFSWRLIEKPALRLRPGTRSDAPVRGSPVAYTAARSAGL
jgi:peptidoglycan/LPS O-acetylase OafA/YrhL